MDYSRSQRSEIVDAHQRISIRSLIKYALSSGDLESRFTGPGRSTEGIRAHREIRLDRPETYIKEVPVSRDFEAKGLLITVSGRIDGIYRNPDGTVLEEIKTTREDLDRAQPEDGPAWAQVKCYAYLYCLEQCLKEIDTQLLLYRLDTGEQREIRRTYLLEELETFFMDLLARYAEWTRTVNDWCRARDLSIGNMEFPFESYRPGQRAMALEVYRAVRDGSQLLVRAATGIGKTMAVLFPSIKAMGEGQTSKIFYLTARTTARAAAEKALDELRAKGLKIKSVTLTAKEKICFRPESDCSGEECEFARGYFDRIQDALKRAFSNDAFTRECIESLAVENRVCPFELSLDLSLWADCIICDYNYVFDPRVYLRRFFQGGHNGFTLLVDEAHNLEDRSREMFSAEIFKKPFSDLRRSLKEDLPVVYKQMGRINNWMVQEGKRYHEAGQTVSEREQPHELYPLLKSFTEETERWLSLNIRTSYREKLLDLYYDVTGFLKISEHFDACYAAFSEKKGRDLRIKLFCIDPSRHLSSRLSLLRSTVFFSATMTPANYYKRILGCDDSAKVLRFPSPFPQENLCVILAGSISTLYRHRDRTGGNVVSYIQSVVQGKKGNYLLYFPSYEYMMMIYKIFAIENPDVEAIIQEPGMREKERDLFLGRFTHENRETLVGFVVMGGIFGEGIDLVGERLSGAVIIGVGLPGISPERELMKSYFNEIGDEGFAYAYTYPGMNRVLQAAGRVIRSDNDRGVILLVDRRFLTYEYQSLLPEEWNPVVVDNNNRLKQALEFFWGHAA